jgi:biopolymer transport protein TolR
VAGSVDDGSEGAFSGINVTPLVDVMLVLLVIFMVTAPMMQQGVAVDLPNASGAALPQSDTAFVVSVTVDGKLFLNDTELPIGELTEKLLAIREEKPGLVVYLRADNDSSYGNVVAVMASLKQAGIEKLGMITETGGG